MFYKLQVFNTLMGCKLYVYVYNMYIYIIETIKLSKITKNNISHVIRVNIILQNFCWNFIYTHIYLHILGQNVKTTLCGFLVKKAGKYMLG